MDDLITKFFQGDLSEAEEQALSDLLSASNEEALRFGAAAEAAYLGFGLPDPKWPGGGPSAPPWSSSIAWKPLLMLPVALATGLAGWVYWQYHSTLNAAIPAPLQTVQPAQSPRTPLPRTAHSISPAVKEVAKAPAAPLVPLPAVYPSKAPLAPVTTPVNLALHPHQTFSNLSVVVRRPSAGDVTVRVLKTDGSPLVLLYQGVLQAGKWDFDWDGKTAEGQLAPPGYYQIQVQTGSLVQKKSILLR